MGLKWCEELLVGLGTDKELTHKALTENKAGDEKEGKVKGSRGFCYEQSVVTRVWRESRRKQRDSGL